MIMVITSITYYITYYTSITLDNYTIVAYHNTKTQKVVYTEFAIT